MSRPPKAAFKRLLLNTVTKLKALCHTCNHITMCGHIAIDINIVFIVA